MAADYISDLFATEEARIPLVTGMAISDDSDRAHLTRGLKA